MAFLRDDEIRRLLDHIKQNTLVYGFCELENNTKINLELH